LTRTHTGRTYGYHHPRLGWSADGLHLFDFDGDLGPQRLLELRANSDAFWG